MILGLVPSPNLLVKSGIIFCMSRFSRTSVNLNLLYLVSYNSLTLYIIYCFQLCLKHTNICQNSHNSFFFFFPVDAPRLFTGLQLPGFELLCLQLKACQSLEHR